MKKIILLVLAALVMQGCSGFTAGQKQLSVNADPAGAIERRLYPYCPKNHIDLLLKSPVQLQVDFQNVLSTNLSVYEAGIQSLIKNSVEGGMAICDPISDVELKKLHQIYSGQAKIEPDPAAGKGGGYVTLPITKKGIYYVTMACCDDAVEESSGIFVKIVDPADRGTKFFLYSSPKGFALKIPKQAFRPGYGRQFSFSLIFDFA